MVCDSAGSECATEMDKDVTLKQALEELLKCMLRVWCREGQALARFGVTTTGNGVSPTRSRNAFNFSPVLASFPPKATKDECSLVKLPDCKC